MNDTAGAGDATIIIRRKGGWRDRLQGYKILLDGELVGSVRANEVLEVKAAAGRHQVAAKISWAGSPPLDVEAEPGEHVRLYCEPNRAYTPLHSLFRPGSWIVLDFEPD